MQFLSALLSSSWPSRCFFLRQEETGSVLWFQRRRTYLQALRALAGCWP